MNINKLHHGSCYVGLIKFKCHFKTNEEIVFYIIDNEKDVIIICKLNHIYTKIFLYFLVNLHLISQLLLLLKRNITKILFAHSVH